MSSFLWIQKPQAAEVLIQFLIVLREMPRLSVLWEIYCIYYFDTLGNFSWAELIRDLLIELSAYLLENVYINSYIMILTWGKTLTTKF